ncbi:MAG: tRNA threonylcarbamoyladenosine biosynthesis protein TsaE [Calditrichaeota bacterium]|nr:tRNA threonylcarbamoyladenosine biosynthesis protein TsaE [Calditrichota bacterium]
MTTEGTHRVDRESATRELAARFARQLRAGDLVAITGPLGAGKTTFVRGLLRALGYEGRVRSPTFTLLHGYPTDPPVHHADFYRLADPEELVALGLDELRERGDVLLVEWADRIPEIERAATWRVHIETPANAGSRRTIRIARMPAPGRLRMARRGFYHG